MTVESLQAPDGRLQGVHTTWFQALLARHHQAPTAAARQAAEHELVQHVTALIAEARNAVPPRVSLERHIISSLVSDPDYEYDCGSDADYCTPLTDQVNQMRRAARGEGLTWHNPAQALPDPGEVVSCLLRHHGSGAMREEQLRKVLDSDLDWRTPDAGRAELGYDWEVLAWRKLPPPLPE
jgi:hypothetical protein